MVELHHHMQDDNIRDLKFCYLMNATETTSCISRT